MEYAKLKEIIKDKERLIFGSAIDKRYLTDGLKLDYGEADVLVFPKNTQEIIEIMKFANENLIPVTPRGSGSCLTGATIPTQKGIILDVSKMNKILEIDEENFNITVEPGVLLKDIQGYVEEKGLFYPPDPGEKTSTIGGNISTNAGGMRAVKYGVTRDYVRELEVITGNGELITVGSKTIKNSSGLDLKDLIIGSEGTLAIITKATLKLMPKPNKTVNILIAFDKLEDGINSVSKILKSNANPTAIEFMERNIVENSEKFLNLKLPLNLGNAYLILTFDGEETEISANYTKAKKAALNSGALEFKVLNDVEANDTWQIRGALASSVMEFNEQVPIDIVVPISKTSEFVEFTNKCGKEYGLQVIYFGHAGDGNTHVSIIRNGLEEIQWKRKSHALAAELYKKSLELNGLPSGEHGIGLTKSEYYKKVTNNVNLQYMKNIKKIFDNNDILNVGKVYS
ncbi:MULTISPECIES: FAD-binding oxidoreductase [unclassified Clostridium]|uniref:FAD-binding oxidoreductase n=1 Tax=unclassified Clostridium TaxID=2614128 RepID=UPI000297249D|nr:MULTISPECIES: FAD-binding oxidoreductase [unclassified Clostridium]EKQ56622.1 MAG: FAD/FMN-dependent dehydrogenase [Clostridium sp. Maddingley MBC34-26]